jgi:hypothetical protein
MRAAFNLLSLWMGTSRREMSVASGNLPGKRAFPNLRGDDGLLAVPCHST